MDRKTAEKLVTDNLPKIYTYAAARLYDYSAAEDLAQEIALEIIRSSERLKDDAAFWGYAWRIADNTFKKYIRRESLRRKAEQMAWDNSSAEIIVPSPSDRTEDKSQEAEQTYLIRRELSLLRGLRRKITISYYIHNKSCSQISEDTGVSVEMVKYHLFEARRQLKEGVNMTRELGEHSYNPGTFRINFWGDWNHYNGIIDRKLREAIMLAAYKSPMTAEELSVELGVAMPFLEEEIDTLETAGLLKKTGKKYQTDIVILPLACEKETEAKTAPLYTDVVKEVYEDLKELLPQIRKLDFEGNDFDDNRLMFMLFNIAAMRAYNFIAKNYPVDDGHDLALGGHGHLWGHDNDYENIHFMGIAMKVNNSDNTVWFSAENYFAIRNCQLYEHKNFMEAANVMWSAMLNNPVDGDSEITAKLIAGGFISSREGVLYANFPVFSEETYNLLADIMLDRIEQKIVTLMIKVSDIGAKILAACTPSHLKGECDAIAKISFRFDVAAIILENMLSCGYLSLPSGKVPLCIFGVKK